MRPQHLRSRQSAAGRLILHAFLALAAGPVPCQFVLGTAGAQVIDIVGNLPASDFSTFISSAAYRDWGNEPFLTVNPLNVQEMICSSFGYAAWVSHSTAQLWHSTNGGLNWSICFSVPTPIAGDNFFVDDQVYEFDGSGVLHGAVMAVDTSGSTYIYHGTTTNVNTSAGWIWTPGTPLPATDPDQPWFVQSGSRLAIAYDEFSAPKGVEQRVAISNDGGITFPAALNLPVGSAGGAPNSTGGSPLNYINPGLRAAIDRQGDIFVVFGMATNGTAGVPNMLYRLNRYSGGATWDFTAASSDAIGGFPIANGPSRQGTSSTFSFGGINVLLGNITSIAVNTNGSLIAVSYGLSDPTGLSHLYLQTFHPSGTGLAPGAPALLCSSTNRSAALPSLAIAENGAVGMLYDDFDGTNFMVHLAVSRDQGASFATNLTLYTFATNGMVLGTGTLNHNRLLGDYQCLVALSNTFYGSFPARGDVALPGLVTTNYIDPFFFAVSALNPIPRPELSQVSTQPGVFQFTLNGQPGVTYILQTSTDLISWNPIATNNSAAFTRVISLNDTDQQGFYRAVVSP